MGKKINRVLYWSPRVLSIVFILFLILMSLDVFEADYKFWEKILALFVHNIPAIILLVVLIISWKQDLVGGISFILAGVIYIALLLASSVKTGFEWHYLLWALQISGTAFLIGIMFLMNWLKKRE